MKIFCVLATFFAAASSLTVVRPSGPVYNREDAKACRAKGDKYVKVGIVGNFACVHLYKDGNKSCESSNDCEGDCIVTDSYNPEGHCQNNDSKFGCFVTIEEFNKGTPILCRD